MTRWWRTTVRYWCRTRDGEASDDSHTMDLYGRVPPE